MNVGSVLDTPSGPAELIFQSGSIQTIDTTGAMYVWGQAYVADAATPNTNSALSGLTSIAGTLSIDFRFSVSLDGDSRRHFLACCWASTSISSTA